MLSYPSFHMLGFFLSSHYPVLLSFLDAPPVRNAKSRMRASLNYKVPSFFLFSNKFSSCVSDIFHSIFNWTKRFAIFKLKLVLRYIHGRFLFFLSLFDGWKATSSYLSCVFITCEAQSDLRLLRMLCFQLRLSGNSFSFHSRCNLMWVRS